MTLRTITITYDPETHVLVPREPNVKMAGAGWDDAIEHEADNIDIYDIAAIYRTMIASAPQPEPVESEPVAYYDPQERGFYWAMPTKIDAPITVMVKPIPLYTTPQPDRTAELEAALKVAHENLDAIRFAVEPYDDIKPRDWKSDRANLRDAHQCAKQALAKINEVLHD